jgi:hypothetical protein
MESRGVALLDSRQPSATMRRPSDVICAFRLFVRSTHDRDELVLQHFRGRKPLADVVNVTDRDVEVATVEELEDIEGSARP